MPRMIIHLDMDAFFASVEQREHPELFGRPVVVGGPVERGVVCAASYEARKYGIRSAMAMGKAMRLCPDAVMLPVRMDLYRRESLRVFDIFAQYTYLVEPLSIDEAFLDVTGSQKLFGPARHIAEEIKRKVRQETALTVSAGIGPNKFVAKLASDFGKPDGLVEITPEMVDSFLLPLPVRRLWGVGHVTAKKMESLGLRTVSDLRSLSRDRMSALFGSSGENLYQLVRGRDERPVEAIEAAKSVGHEDTYSRDIYTKDEMQRELLGLAEKVAWRVRRKRLVGRCITLKVKYADFVTVTRSQTFSSGLDNASRIYEEASILLEKTQAGQRPVRLLGISLSLLEEKEKGQVELFGEEDRSRMSSLDKAVDLLRERYGEGGVCRASLLTKRLDESAKNK